MDTLKIIRPDDWHLHLRDNQALETTVPAAARCFGRSIIMPNLNPPVTHVEMAYQYRNRILKHRPANSDWQPLMVLYLTDNTSPNEIYAAAESGFIHGCKYYPAGATTNSDSGVTDLNKMNSVFKAMQETGMLLLMHGEVTSTDIAVSYTHLRAHET